MQCPLRYRFRVIDRIPEPPSLAATRGTLVHWVLERIFDLPAAARTPAAAHELVRPGWQDLLTTNPALASLFPPVEAPAQDLWFEQVRGLLDRWFTLENPQRLEPSDRELFVQARLDSGLLLRGYIDRLDIAPAGQIRVVDYKTGRAPRAEYESGALFQMRFYALVLWRSRKVIPDLMQLVYLGDGQVLRQVPQVAELTATEVKLDALGQAISTARATGHWPAKVSRLCDWCNFKDLCPQWGGTPPPLPQLDSATALPLNYPSTVSNSSRDGSP